jgi:hypothetical protein
VAEETLDIGQVQSAMAAVTQESWYAYDKLNRVTVVNGALENGQVVVAKNARSYGVSYDAAGNEVSQYQWRTNGNVWWTTVKQQTYSLRGELLLTFNEARTDGSDASRVVERRVYDDAGRQVQRLQYFSPNTTIRWVDDEATVMYTHVDGWLNTAELTTYDDDGRLLTQVQRTRSEATTSRTPYGSGNPPLITFPTWVIEASENEGVQSSDVNQLTRLTTISYAPGANRGYDAAGRVVGYTYTDGGRNYTHTYTYAYTGWDSYRELSITGSSSNPNYKTTVTTLSYDLAGRQKEIREHTNDAVIDDRIRSFAFDSNGMILSRRDGTTTGTNFVQGTGNVLLISNLHNVYANGQQIAGLDEYGKLDVTSRMTAFSNSASGSTQVVVQAGETLKGIAQRVYPNAGLVGRGVCRRLSVGTRNGLNH